MKAKKIKSITIIGKRWFDKVYGNTYFSSIGLVDGVQVVKIDFEYGYERHFEDRTGQEIEKAGYTPNLEHYKNGMSESIWQYCKRNDIVYSCYVSDVSRKKDLRW